MFNIWKSDRNTHHIAQINCYDNYQGFGSFSSYFDNMPGKEIAWYRIILLRKLKQNYSIKSGCNDINFQIFSSFNTWSEKNKTWSKITLVPSIALNSCFNWYFAFFVSCYFCASDALESVFTAITDFSVEGESTLSPAWISLQDTVTSCWDQGPNLMSAFVNTEK